jgi:Mor family transcriptional regulator
MTEATDTTTESDQTTIKPELQSRLNAVPLADDVVDYMLACFQAVSARTSAAALQAVERQVREVFGNTEVWIAKGQNKLLAQLRAERDEKIRRDYLSGERLELLERRYALSKRRLFQIVKS